MSTLLQFLGDNVGIFSEDYRHLGILGVFTEQNAV